MAGRFIGSPLPESLRVAAAMRRIKARGRAVSPITRCPGHDVSRAPNDQAHTRVHALVAASSQVRRSEYPLAGPSFGSENDIPRQWTATLPRCGGPRERMCRPRNRCADSREATLFHRVTPHRIRACAVGNSPGPSRRYYGPAFSSKDVSPHDRVERYRTRNEEFPVGIANVPWFTGRRGGLRAREAEGNGPGADADRPATFLPAAATERCHPPR